jgi:hypothetical protein
MATSGPRQRSERKGGGRPVCLRASSDQERARVTRWHVPPSEPALPLARLTFPESLAHPALASRVLRVLTMKEQAQHSTNPVPTQVAVAAPENYT